MKKKRFFCGADSECFGASAGVPVAEVIRKAGINEQTFFRWKAKCAGLEVDEVRQMAQLQEREYALEAAAGGAYRAQPVRLRRRALQ